MGRQRNNTHSKGKEEFPERRLNKIEASKLSDTEFKIMFMGMLNELSESYKELQGSYKELTENYSSMKKDIETMNKGQEEMKNTTPEKNTLEGNKSRLEEADN